MTSRQSTRRLAVIAALLLSAAGGWWWLHGRIQSDVSTPSTGIEAPSTGAARSTTTANNSTPADVAKKTTAGPVRPLPPDNTPLADVFDELTSRADAGDAHAACRLAVDLLDCGTLNASEQGQLDGLRKSEIAAEKKGNLSEANGYAEMQSQLVAARQRCAGIDEEHIEMAGKYLRRAAKAGVPEAMLRYADGQGFGRAPGLSALRNPDFDAWRREAPNFMRASLQSGRPEAVLALADAYRTDSETYFSALVPNDVVLARAYYVVYLRLLGKNAPADKPMSAEELAQLRRAGVDTSAANPTPDQLRRADAEADRLYRSYFEGRPLTNRRSVARWLMVGPRITTEREAAPPPRCN